MKKLAVLLLGLSLFCLPLFAGGTAQGDRPGQAGGLVTLKVRGVDREINADGKQVALSDWISGRVPSGLWEKYLKDLESRNIKLEFDLIKGDQATTALQTTLASGRLNDYDFVYAGNAFDDTTLIRLAGQGRFHAINKGIEQYSDGEAKKFYFDDPITSTSRKIVTLEDGNMYWIVAPGGTTINGRINNSNGLQSGNIRYDWLKTLGLDIPKTTDEFYNALVAFRDNDMNKNGVKDEVARVAIDGFLNGIAQWFGLGSDIISNIDYKAVSPWYQPHIRDYFAYMKKLNDAGLITISTEANDMASNRISYVHDWSAQAWHEPTIKAPDGAARPFFAPFMLKAVSDTEPRLWTEEGLTLFFNAVGFSPSGSRRLDTVIKWLDYSVSKDGYMLSEVGIEGVTYKVTPEGLVDRIPPGPAQVGVDNIIIYQSHRALWGFGIFPRFAFGLQKEANFITYKQRGASLGYDGNLKNDIYVEAWNGRLPFVRDINSTMAIPTEKQSERIKTLLPDLTTYSQELASGLVMGQKNINNWDAYMADLKRLGLDELIGVYQERLDRAQR